MPELNEEPEALLVAETSAPSDHSHPLKRALLSTGKIVLELSMASLLMFAALSLPAYLSRFQGKLAGSPIGSWFGHGRAAEPLTIPLPTGSALDPFAASQTATPRAAASQPTIAPAAVSEFGADELTIPSLSITAPVSFGVSLADSVAKLKEGVVQLDTTKRPNENGPTFIVGHSSSLPWDKNSYGQIFAKLPDIKDGAEISVRYQGERYRYTVSSRKTVKPDEIILPTSKQLILMTCVPVGTSQNRLLVFATPS